MKRKSSFINSIINTLLSVIKFAGAATVLSIPAAALSILIHLSVYEVSVIYQVYLYPVFILLLVILSIYLYKKKEKKRLSLFITGASAT